jgi:hypothetical protein
MRAGDWPSEQFAAKCEEWGRECPYIRFASYDVSESERRGAPIIVGRTPVTYLPTVAFFRNGAPHGQLVGTDYPAMEKIIAQMHHDGANIAPVRPVRAHGIIVESAGNHAIFTRRKVHPHQ